MDLRDKQTESYQQQHWLYLTLSKINTSRTDLIETRFPLPRTSPSKRSFVCSILQSPSPLLAPFLIKIPNVSRRSSPFLLVSDSLLYRFLDRFSGFLFATIAKRTEVAGLPLPAGKRENKTTKTDESRKEEENRKMNKKKTSRVISTSSSSSGDSFSTASYSTYRRTSIQKRSDRPRRTPFTF